MKKSFALILTAMIALTLPVYSAEQTAEPTPLEKGEISLGQMSINDITEKYGAFGRVNYYGQFASGEIIFDLSCDSAAKTFVDYGKALSFAAMMPPNTCVHLKSFR